MTSTASLTSRLEPVTDVGGKLCAVIDELAGFLAEQAAINDRTGQFARDSVARLTEAGVLAACAPVADGGFGLESLYDLAVVTSRLAQADASVAIAAYMHLALSSYYARTVRCAPAEQRAGLAQRQWLAAIGRREMIVCSAVAEPGVDPSRLNTTARQSDVGWVINGRKALASISPAATHFYTRLKGETDAGAIQGTVMISRDAPGVEVRDNWDGLGLRGSGSGEVIFSGVALPSAALSPRGGWGTRNARGYEGRAATSAPLLAVYLGIAEAAHDMAVASLAGGPNSRTRAASAGVKVLVAEMELRMAAARGTLHTVLADIDAHVSDAAPRSLPAELGRSLMAGCVAAGMVVERAATEVVDLAMQVCGGRSYVAGHPLGRICRDVRACWFMRPHPLAEEWLDFLADPHPQEPDVS